MSLATRCPACGTIFRVVQDQLKVSEGWVRCGQCHEVFHGIEALFDLDSDPAIAARRAARGGPAPQAAPSTRVFAENRANAPIPTPEPPAGIVVPSPPPPSASASPAPPPARRFAPAPVPMAPPGASRPLESRPIPPAGFAPGSPVGATDPLGAPGAAPRVAQAGVARGTIAPRFAARLAEDSARAQAGLPPEASRHPGTGTGSGASPIPSAFPEAGAPAAEPVPDLGSWPSAYETMPSAPEKPPGSAVETSAWQTATPPSAAAPPQEAWSMPSAWQPSSPETDAAPPPASNSWALPPPPASPPAAWRSPPAAAEPVPSAWPSAGSPSAPAPSAWASPAPTPTSAEPPEAAWQPAPPRPIAPAWQPPAAAPVAPPPTIWETPPGAPAPARPSFTAPTEPMPLDERPPIAPSPGFQPSSLASPSAFGHDSSSFAPASLDAATGPAALDAPPAAKLAAELAEDFAAAPAPAPARQPRTLMPKPAAEPLVRPPAQRAAPSPDIGGSTLPSMLADDAAADEDARAGPPTLASMLPEDAGEWPPRKKGRKLREPQAAAAEATLESERAISRRNDPRFLREAQSDARWRRPWVRAVLGVSLTVLVVAAIAQVAWPQRDLLAARWPATLPAWNGLCAQAGCRIEPPRAVASLALDGSALNRTDTEHVLLFSADLHNRADHAVRMPSFDLTFMDINGAIVSRKVLSPEQIGIRQAALGPEAELHVHVRLQVGTLDASGFQAEMFYP